MNETSTAVAQHYSGERYAERIIDAARSAGIETLTATNIAPADEFHTGGLRSTRELAELAGFRPGISVLDIGCGLGGQARPRCGVRQPRNRARLHARIHPLRPAAYGKVRPGFTRNVRRRRRPRDAVSRCSLRCRLDAARRHEHQRPRAALPRNVPGPEARRTLRFLRHPQRHRR